MSKTVGIVGLGKMGKGLARQLLEKKWQVAVWNRSPEPRAELEREGAVAHETLESLVASLPAPRCILVVLPNAILEEILPKLADLLSPKDTLIDGGNSLYLDTMRRFEAFSASGLHFIDAGISGGPSGARHGACIMVGGEEAPVRAVEDVFIALATPGGYVHAGKSGAGHFVKMVHNGIEYGMMQAIAEGFTILRESPFDLSLADVAKLYNTHSVIESRLIGWLQDGFARYGEGLETVSGTVRHTGEGAWTVDAGRKLGVPTPVIEASLAFRVDSEKHPSYAGKVLSALRNQFGGHDI